MTEPITTSATATAAGWGLVASTLIGFITSVDYSIVFGAFAGSITARCRCNGTGRVRDLKMSAMQGALVDKECERCSGRGYKRIPSSGAFRAVSVLLPDLQERKWNCNWKPFFEKLVAKCEIEESYANAQFRKVTH